jgi:ParB family transcriptional regulator, chromosome partitioning protein
MIKRKDLLKTAFNSETAPVAAPVADRVPSGAVRAMGLSLGRIGENAAKAEALEQQIARGEVVQDLDPNLIEPSFVEDRLARTADPEFRRLVDSIGTAGQQAPILVRPHPERAGRYQVAYGHRRLSACVELAQKVKAIVRPLTDSQLVVAQGKENAERRNLSFIERAQFAAHLEQKGFERPVIQAALAVHPAELTRLLAVARSIPAHVIAAIGPSPRAGRPRWMEFATLLGAADGKELITTIVGQASFQRLSSDARFELAIEKLRSRPHRNGNDCDVIRNRAGNPVIRAERSATTLKLIIDLRVGPGLDEHLLALLPGIVSDFSSG